MRAILFDATKCIGCGSCEEACRTKNGLPEQQATDLNATRFTVLKKVSRGQDETYLRRLCMHCLDPACASVCPVGALKKTRQGPMVYESSACLGAAIASWRARLMSRATSGAA